MIFSALKKSLFNIIFSPWVLLPFVAVFLVTSILSNLVADVVQKPIVDMVLYYETLEQSNFAYIFLTQYPLEILTIILFGFVGLVISSVALLTIARVAKKVGFIDAVNDSVMDFGKAIGLGVIFFSGIVIVSAALLVLSFVIDLVAKALPGFGSTLGAIIFFAIIIIFGAILLVKFSFIIPAMVDEKIKKAIQKSWAFSNDKFLSTLALIVVLIIISFIITLIAQNIALMVDPSYELIIATIGEIISTTFFGLCIANYYFDNN